MKDLKKEEIIKKAGTLSNYERFKYQWAIVCARLNPTEKNRKILENMIYEKTEGFEDV